MRGREAAVPGPARVQITRFVDRWSVLLRASSGIGVAVVGLLSRVPTAGAVVVLGAYLAWWVVRLVLPDRGASQRLLLTDVVVVLAVALATPVVCTAEETASLSGLAAVAVAAASATLVWQLRGGRAVLWVLAACVATAVGGSLVPGVGPADVLVSRFLPVQGVVVWLLVHILRRGADRTDRESAALAAAVATTELAATRRAAEREHWAILHDTAAATLLMVGDGVPASAAERVRRQAGRDLVALAGAVPVPVPAAPDAGPAEPLAPALRAVAAEFPLAVALSDPDDARVPAEVLAALRDAVRELLTNVERHAGVGAASVALRGEPDGAVAVAVTDTGRGLGERSAEGRGLRESVRARVERVGGAVEVRAGEGGGVAVSLRWPAPGDGAAAVAA